MKTLKPKSAYNENLHTTLDLYSAPDAQTDLHNSEPNQSFRETSQWEPTDGSRLECTEVITIIDDEDTSACVGNEDQPLEPNPPFIETNQCKQTSVLQANCEQFVTMNNQTDDQDTSAQMEFEDQPSEPNPPLPERIQCEQTSISQSDCTQLATSDFETYNVDTSAHMEEEHRLRPQSSNDLGPVFNGNPTENLQQSGSDEVPHHVQSIIMELRRQINSCRKKDIYGNL